MAEFELNHDLMEHIDALRGMLLKIIAAFILLCIPCWFLVSPVLDYLLSHSTPDGFKLHYFSLLEPFFTDLKVMLVLAVMTSLPFTLFFIWQFVAPALMDDEKRMIRPLLGASFGLAYAGAAVAYFILMPCVINFSKSFSGPNMDPVIGIGSFVSMLLVLILGGALLFQFPVVLFILLTVGVIDVDGMRRKRPYVIVAILILAGILTPPDVVSQLLLAVPTWLLYEFSIVIFHFYKKRDSSLAVYQEAERNSHSS